MSLPSLPLEPGADAPRRRHRVPVDPLLAATLHGRKPAVATESAPAQAPARSGPLDQLLGWLRRKPVQKPTSSPAGSGSIEETWPGPYYGTVTAEMLKTGGGPIDRATAVLAESGLSQAGAQIVIEECRAAVNQVLSAAYGAGRPQVPGITLKTPTFAAAPDTMLGIRHTDGKIESDVISDLHWGLRRAMIHLANSDRLDPHYSGPAVVKPPRSAEALVNLILGPVEAPHFSVAGTAPDRAAFLANLKKNGFSEPAIDHVFGAMLYAGSCAKSEAVRAGLASSDDFDILASKRVLLWALTGAVEPAVIKLMDANLRKNLAEHIGLEMKFGLLDDLYDAPESGANPSRPQRRQRRANAMVPR